MGNGFAVYSYAQEAVPGILYPIDGQVFRVYIRDKKSPEIPAELLSGFRLVLGRVFHEDFSDIKTDLEERLLALGLKSKLDNDEEIDDPDEEIDDPDEEIDDPDGEIDDPDDPDIQDQLFR